MLDKIKNTDAFGNVLIIGETYGYARNVNAMVTTFYGELIHVTEKGSGTIKILKRFSAVYHKNVKESNNPKSTTSVKGNMLIPMSNKTTIPSLEQYTLMEYRKQGDYHSRASFETFTLEEIQEKYDYLVRHIKEDL